MTESQSTHDLAPGTVLDNAYRIDEPLARGGFADVYLGTKVPEDMPVVVKVLHHQALEKDRMARQRFVREAAIAMQLHHPNHVKVYAFGNTPSGLPYLVAERLYGEPLDEKVERKPMRPAQVLVLLEQVMGGLVELHRHGVAHRDIKPANVFVCHRDDGDLQVKILDYGLAKVLSPDHPIDMANLTTKDIVVGTPGYLAPELLLGAPVTKRVDIYSSGILAWELLTGRFAYEGGHFEKAVAQSQGNPPPPPSAAKRSPLWPVIERMLARDPAARYQSAQEVVDALRTLRETDALATAEQAFVAAETRAAKMRSIFIGLGVLVAILILIAVLASI